MLTPDFQAIAPESTFSPLDALFRPKGEIIAQNESRFPTFSITGSCNFQKGCIDPSVHVVLAATHCKTDRFLPFLHTFRRDASVGRNASIPETRRELMANGT